MNGKLDRRHCINSTSETYHGDRWVKARIEVRGHSVIRHFIEGQKVHEYQKPQLDERDKDAKKIIAARKGDLKLSKGSISLQAESHPCEFRKIRLRPVKPAKKK